MVSAGGPESLFWAAGAAEVAADATRMSGPDRKGSRRAGTVEARRCLRRRERGGGGFREGLRCVTCLEGSELRPSPLVGARILSSALVSVHCH